MTDAMPLLQLAIEPDRPLEDRLRALNELGDQLRSEGPVLALLEAASRDSSPAFRRAALSKALAVDAGVVSDRSAYALVLARIAAADPERDNRVLALVRLGELPVDVPWYEELMVAMIESGEEPEIAPAARALARRGRVSPGAGDRLAGLLDRAPVSRLADAWVVGDALDDANRERFWAAGLAQDRPVEMKRASLARLGALARLGPETLERAARLMSPVEDREVRRAALGLLTRFGADGWGDTVLDLVTRESESNDLLTLLKDQMAVQPDTVAALGKLLGKTRWPSLRAALLDLLAESREVALLAAGALGDPEPIVREAALRALGPWLHAVPEAVATVLTAGFSAGADEEHRTAVLEMVEAVPSWTPEAEQAFLTRLGEEPPGRVRWRMAASLARLMSRKETSAEVRARILEVLADPAAPLPVRLTLLDRLAAEVLPSEAPLRELAGKALLASYNPEEASRLWVLWKSLAPSEDERVALLPDLFFRFAWLYPMEPAAAWAQELAGLAGSRREAQELAPDLAAATGDARLLQAQGPAGAGSEFLQEMLDIMRESNLVDYRRAGQRLKEAFNEGRLKKKHVRAILETGLRWPPDYPLVDAALEIAAEAGLATTEIVDTALDFVTAHPRELSWGRTAQNVAFNLTRYVREAGPLVSDLGERLAARFTSDHHRRYQRLAGGALLGSQAWSQQRRESGEVWPLAHLAKDLGFRDLLFHALKAEPLHPDWPDHFHLAHTVLWLLPLEGGPAGQNLSAVAALIRRMEPVTGLDYLRDRAAAVFVTLARRLGSTVPSWGEETLAAAAISFRHQVLAWGSLTASERVEVPQPIPWMPVSGLDGLKAKLGAKWADFLKAYGDKLASLFGNAGDAGALAPIRWGPSDALPTRPVPFDPLTDPRDFALWLGALAAGKGSEESVELKAALLARVKTIGLSGRKKLAQATASSDAQVRKAMADWLSLST